MGVRLVLFSFSLVACLLSQCARSDSTGTQLLKGINSYRASLNLTDLSENSNAACLAEQLAKQFKGQQCTNSTGDDTVPGTEEQFPNYPSYLSHCHLNVTVTQDAQVMPACVPGLVSDVILTNYTKSQYNQYLNDSKYVGAGIADEGDWVVVVLSTNTPTGSFSPASADTSGTILASFSHFVMFVLLGFLGAVLM
ncbi:Glycoprotein membrane precursor GPI-anchored [Rhynchospora pubera]|uniref:Glycoprotein membrane GPI-anchored n=1 Tax=Rhynchospora pubera TaxID=906938 RepID=A0AAV8D8D5_9POAL|nr:Glycoprotein membrane precursor GPI-anchored [Rhynchospora pubera]